ncbi:PucR family transcriptional regulator [Nonomuraea sp. SYSU D8015]|uniref:PucR family transcriptional regulator n=1 Tax=Nonomuraea sp. SYSU D8015 TaxID=2593644 RepID=UPI001661794E|nr:helix-turn-helix domain-containing protein [Nonomuraea sp. SYSU D8015]
MTDHRDTEHPHASDGHTGPLPLAEIAARASADAGGVPAQWLKDYLPLLAEVSQTGRRPDAAALSRMRECGESAARDGLPLRAIIDVHLSATWLAWPVLPGIIRSRRAEDLRAAGEAVFKAADRSIAALVEGYETAQRLVIRREEALRREFIDDLLHGRRDVGTLAERAERFGLRLAGAHTVAIAEAKRPFFDGGPVSRHVEASLLSRFGLRDILVATKEGLLVCVSSGYMKGVSEAFGSAVQEMMDGDPSLRICVGRAHHGPGGVVRSFEEARSVVSFAHRLDLPERMLYASDLLVLQVLVRDNAAISELVETVLGPLRAARGGPDALLETLFAYFATGGVATLTARRLHVGVRTVTYRLERVRELTGYGLNNPIQRHALETATLGARLLGWPQETVTSHTRPPAP